MFGYKIIFESKFKKKNLKSYFSNIKENVKTLVVKNIFTFERTRILSIKPLVLGYQTDVRQ